MPSFKAARFLHLMNLWRAKSHVAQSFVAGNDLLGRTCGCALDILNVALLALADG